MLKDVDFVTKAQTSQPTYPGMNHITADGVIDVNIVQVDGSNIKSSGLPVKVENMVDINLKEVKGSNFYSGVPVRIENSSASESGSATCN